MFVSCKKENRFDLIKRTGKETVEERDLVDFTTLLLYHRIDVELVSDTINKAIVTAGKNIIGNIPTRIENGILTIEDNNKFKWSRSYDKTLKVELHCKNLRHIKLYGGGNVYNNKTFKGDTLTVEMFASSGNTTLDLDVKVAKSGQHAGPANLTFTGNCRECNVYTIGNGIFHTENLYTSQATLVNNGGTSDCYVNVNGYFEVQIYYIGNIYYSGNPTVIYSTINGEGKLIKL